MDTGAAVRTLRGHNGRVWALAVAGGGRRLCSASVDKTVMVWCTETWECLRVMQARVCVCMWACARVRVCVCLIERERERE